MPWQFLIRGSIILAAFKFPKFQIIFGFFVIMLMNIICMLFLFIAWIDYGTEPISVIKFEIGTGLVSLLTGWVLGVALIRQGRRKVGHANKNSSSPAKYMPDEILKPKQYKNTKIDKIIKNILS